MHASTMYRILFMLVFFATPAWAIEKLNYPQVVKDRMQVEYLGFAEQEAPSGDRWRTRVQTTYGLTDRIDVALSYLAENQEGMHTRSVGPSARLKYEMTEQDDWWLSSAVQLRYTHATDGRANTLNTRLMLQRDFGDWLSTANFSVIRGIGEKRDPSVAVTGAAQLLYQYAPEISPGIEVFHSFGAVNDLDYTGRNSQEIGPIVAGALPLADQQQITYVLGYYRGLSAESPEQSAKLQVNYVVDF